MSPSLPPFIFLMSNHETNQLAADVAEALSHRYPEVFVDDFLAPIHEGLSAMFELDWKRDMGNPTMVGPTERDQIVSLEKWFIDEFGLHRLGQMALARCNDRNETADYVTVFRDATEPHLEGFDPDDSMSDRQFKIVHLKPEHTVDYIMSILTSKG